MAGTKDEKPKMGMPEAHESYTKVTRNITQLSQISHKFHKYYTNITNITQFSLTFAKVNHTFITQYHTFYPPTGARRPTQALGATV